MPLIPEIHANEFINTLLYFSLIYQFFMTIIFLPLRLSRFSLLIYASSFMSVLPFYEFPKESLSGSMHDISIIGLAIFAIVLPVYFIDKDRSLANKPNLFIVVLLTISSLSGVYFFAILQIKITIIFSLGFCIYLIYLSDKIIHRYFIFLLTGSTLFLIFTPFTSNIPAVYTAGTLSVFFFIFKIFEFRKKLSTVSRHLTHGIESNQRMNHEITRLHLRIDQYKRILHDKDREIFQIARHASLAEITSGIAHELVQPLTGIKGIAQNMIDDIEYDEFIKNEALEELSRICGLVNKSTRIIDHIRNFAQKKSLSFTPVHINKAVLNAMDLVHIQLKRSNIDVIFFLDDSIPEINGDILALEQLIVNLVINARDAINEKQKFTTEHIGKIKIKTLGLENWVQLIVEDNGPGIPSDLLNQIWSPFFTTKKNALGTGIGLAIGKKIIQEHHAEVKVDSGPEGTKFTINFPV